MAGNYDQANLERISVKAEDSEKYYKNAMTGSENLYCDRNCECGQGLVTQGFGSRR